MAYLLFNLLLLKVRDLLDNWVIKRDVFADQSAIVSLLGKKLWVGAGCRAFTEQKPWGTSGESPSWEWARLSWAHRSICVRTGETAQAVEEEFCIPKCAVTGGIVFRCSSIRMICTLAGKAFLSWSSKWSLYKIMVLFSGAQKAQGSAGSSLVHHFSF